MLQVQVLPGLPVKEGKPVSSVWSDDAGLPVKKKILARRLISFLDFHLLEVIALAIFEQSLTFLKEAVSELKKVTRPTRKEVIASSIVVLVVTLLFMVITLAEDQLIGWLIGLLFNK